MHFDRLSGNNSVPGNMKHETSHFFLTLSLSKKEAAAKEEECNMEP
jgi:hypothetical protein